KVKGIGLGDPQLEVKFRAHGEVKDPFVVGVAAFVSGPLGNATAEGGFIGDSSPVAGIRGIIDGKEGPLSVGANLSGLYRSAARVGSTELGSEFRYNVAVGYEATPVIRVVAEGYGTTKFSAQNGTNSLEVDLGAMITPLGSPVTVTLGGGPGVIEGVGVPTFRALAGVMYVAESTEADGDGIPDGKDQCPTEPEDKDGYEDADGCPDKDNDGDTIADTDDKCPMNAEDPDGFQDTDGCPDDDNDQDGVDDSHDQCGDKKETKNGFKDDDGCPDEPDQDSDGVADAKDQCPDKPEDTDGFQDTDGCPDPDNDGDGIPDEDDECVDEPETKNGITDTDGCPDKGPDDQDSDGIPDKADKCPTEPEDKNGIKDDDGCPDALATVTGTEIEIRGVINFANNDTKIVGAKSYEILDAVAAIMKEHTEIKLIEVQGHTDGRGNADKNMKLSDGRAAACRDYLVSKGVEATRFEAKGYGQTKPIADNKTQKGRDQNRRVEFAIVKK
ncbi:MAG: hypothetical protein FJW96_14640, partial [Actinobacteria bacterium]|nr:hypothetical protein [Actinomycetota bacterium]